MRKRLALPLTSLVVLVTGLVALAGPAHAATPMDLVYAETTSDSSTTKEVYVACPSGRIVVGGGAMIHAWQTDSHFIYLTSMEPVVTQTSAGYSAAAREIAEGFEGDWSLSVFAQCTAPLPGYEVVAMDGPSGSGPQLNFSVPCPPGKRPIGFGGTAAVEDDRRVLLTRLMTYGGDIVVVGSHEEWDAATNQGYETEPWTIHGTAICIDAIVGVEVKTGTGVHTGPEGYLVYTVKCTDGKIATAVGLAIFNGVGQVGMLELRVVGDPPPVAPWHGVWFAIEDPVGTDAPWYVQHAIVCVPFAD